MKKCREFGRSQDNFGKRVQINYRGKMTYGTALGGFISFCARMTIWFIAAAQLWACFFDSKYVESVIYKKLSAPNEERYEIKYHQGFPSFSILSPA